MVLKQSKLFRPIDRDDELVWWFYRTNFDELIGNTFRLDLLEHLYKKELILKLYKQKWQK